MKCAHWIPVVLACSGLLAAHAADDVASSSAPKETSVSPTDRDLVAAETLRLFLSDIAKKYSVGTVKIYYVGFPAGTRVSLENFASEPHQLRTASDKELQNGIYFDEATGQPCVTVSISMKSIDGDSALATVSWRTSPRSGAVMDYRLMKSGGSWKATAMVAGGVM